MIAEEGERIAGEGGAIGLDGLVEPALCRENHGEIVVHLDGADVEGDRLAQDRDRLVELRQLLQGDAEIDVIAGDTRMRCDRAPVGGGGFERLCLAAQEIAEVEMRSGEIRPEGECLPVGVRRFGQAVGGEIGVA